MSLMPRRETPISNGPIAVVPAVMKIFERAIHKQIYKHLTTHKLLSTHQSGFRPGHSTATCVLDVSDFILKSKNKGLLTGGIFLDLSKTFDLIDHTILKAKLKSIGFLVTSALNFMPLYSAIKISDTLHE